MDNRVFNVNGEMDADGLVLLQQTLVLAFSQVQRKAEGWCMDAKRGLVLFKCGRLDNEDGCRIVPFPVPLGADQVYELVVSYLTSKPECECVDVDDNADHDGDNVRGWRVYCDMWGHVEDYDWRSFLAIKPAWIWHGR